MNLIPVDHDPVEAAKALPDRLVVTQIGEASAVLQAALVAASESGQGWVHWAASDPTRFSWAWLYLDALHREHERRLGHLHSAAAFCQDLAEKHPSGNKVRALAFMDPPGGFPRTRVGRTTLEHIEDDVEAARQIVAWRLNRAHERGSPPTWTARPRPSWLASDCTFILA